MIIDCVNAIIQELEELSFRTLPALEQERYDRWVLRWSDGGSRRGNSVNPVASSALSLEEKVEHCERWFAARSAPAIFRLTALADAELPAVLSGRGYIATSPTDVMTLEIGDRGRAKGVDVDDHPSDFWLATVTGHEPGSAEGKRLASQLMSGVGRVHFASIMEGADTVAIGMSAGLERFTTIYNMNTDATYRRRGLARSILTTLLAIGQEAGSTHAVLQVTADNTAAQALYREFEFSTAYRYRYMQRGAHG